MHRRVCIFRCGLALLALLSVSASQAATHTLISGGVSGEDYAQSVFRRIGEVWVAPQGLHGNFRTEIELSIDSSGMLSDCRVVRPSGLEALDSSTCGAAYKIGRFAPPPEGQPIRLVCSFQIQKTQAEEDDPDKALMEEVRAHARRQTEYRTREAGYAEEDARARAEAAARERGETFAGYDFVPGQDIPDAPTLLQRTPTVVVAPRDGAQNKAAAEKPSAEGTKAQPVAPGHIISRYPPRPGDQELVVDPHGKKPAAEATPGSAQPVQPAQDMKSAQDVADKGQGAAKSGKDSQPAGQAETKAQPAQEYVLPQPPLPPRGVRGRVINPAAPATALPLSARPDEKAEKSQTPAASPEKGAQPAPKKAPSTAKPVSAQPASKVQKPAAGTEKGASAQGKVPLQPQQPPLPPKGVKGQVIEPASPAKDRPVSVQPAGKVQKPAASPEKGVQSAQVETLPQPPLPPRGVKGRVIDPAAPVTPLPVTPRPAVRMQEGAASAQDTPGDQAAAAPGAGAQAPATGR